METTFTYRAPYPVITTKPTFDQTLSATTSRDWTILGGVTALCGGAGSMFARPFRIKYGMGLVTASCVAVLGFMGVMRSAVLRLEGYSPNEWLVKKYPYRLDSQGQQIRVEPFRQPTPQEFQEILRNPRQ